MKFSKSFFQKLVIWLTGYANLIAFIIGGGYIYTKCDDEEIKCTARLSLILVGGFVGLDMLYTMLFNLLKMFGAEYTTLEGVSLISNMLSILRVVVFAVFFILDALGELNRLKAKLRTPDTKSEAEEE